MRRIVALLAVLAGAMFLSPALLAKLPAEYANMSAKEILDRVDDLFRGDASHGRMTMTITTPNWKRSLSCEVWNKGKNRALIRILAPQKEKGTATLRSGNDLWNYLPKVKRVIKLPSSMMSASWMGSHFSNDDLVKETRMADDYTFEKTFDGTRNGRDEIEITCIPKPEAAVVWGKVVVHVDSTRVMPTYIDYFDEDMKLARTLTFSEYKKFGRRELPAHMKLVPTAHPDESTVVHYDDINFDIQPPDDLFSLRSLQQ